MKKIVLLTMALMMVSSVSFACSSGGEDAAGEEIIQAHIAAREAEGGPVIYMVGGTVDYSDSQAD
ncbi:MAG: hypothetical protein LKE51_10120 [Selenomonas sp.]|jgi:hypothetical protein|nr:hypothetical protein [Selenomonas sp.]